MTDGISPLEGAVDLLHAFQKPKTGLAPYFGRVNRGDDIAFAFHETPPIRA
jgi:hypothetical protein